VGIQSNSALIAAILLLALGINVAFSDRRAVHRASFVGLVAAFFAYNLSFFFDSVVGGGFWHRVVVLSGVAVAQTSLRFFERYLEESSRTVRAGVNLASAAVVVLALTRLGGASHIAAVSALLAAGTYGYCVWRLYKRYRQVQSRVEAIRLLYLVIGGVFSASASALDLLPLVGLPFPAVGHLLTVVYLYIWTQVIQRSRLLDLQEMLGRGLSLALLAAVVSSLYSLLVVWLRDELGLFFFNTLVASVVLIFVIEPLKKAVDVWTGRLVFRESFELETQLAMLRVELSSVIDLGDLVTRVLARLQQSRRVTHASLYLLENEGHAYVKVDALGPVQTDRVSVVAGRTFLEALRSEKALALENVERELLDLEENPAARERLAELRDTMEAVSAGLSVALLSGAGETGGAGEKGDRLLGFLNVKDERLREAFSSAEIDRIAGLTVQITAVVENTELFEKLKERDRLSYIGEMATGMAHEIRNPLASIKAAAELLDPDRLDEEQREWVDVMVQETNRLNVVLSQFLDYARPYRGELAPVDVATILSRVATLVRALDRDPPIDVQVEIDADVPKVMADGDRIQQVCLNLARNACDAMTEGGTLTLSARAYGRESPRVELRVHDDGPGIPAEVRKNLFIPFYTTKRDGTGLGLAISERILEHHGSSIRVDSTLGDGTTMRFSLAAAQRDAE